LGGAIPRSLGPTGAGGASIPRLPNRQQSSKDKQKVVEKERSPTPDWGVDDDDIIEIDSD